MLLESGCGERQTNIQNVWILCTRKKVMQIKGGCLEMALKYWKRKPGNVGLYALQIS